jgi:hypothetical protein
MNKYKLKCLQGSDIFDEDQPQTKKGILERFKMWFDEEIESFKGKINFKNIQEYYQVKIIKLKKVDKTRA